MTTMNFKRVMNVTLVVVTLSVMSLCFGCREDFVETESPTVTLMTKSIPTPSLDWENLDWMPTPSGQQIPSPWIGQGSIASLYGIDVLNDRKASDGWVLVYNTFTSNTSSQLVNPYFVLYNKYRGILRFYLYITTQFVSPSSYVQDAISVVTNGTTTMLNLTGNSINDASLNRKTYSQIQPAPMDGSLPLASNKWYMMQYEIGYDPSTAKMPYNQIQLSWAVNYFNIQTINLGGEAVGSVKGTVGGSDDNKMFSSLGNLGKVVGKGVVAGIGNEFLENNKIDSTGANKLGLPKTIFKAALTGVNAALKGTTGNIPGAVVDIFSSILGGASSSAMMVNLNIQTDITLNGTGTNSGSFPSSPTSFWVPGTTIPITAIGYIPLFQQTMGVLNFKGKPNITIDVKKHVEMIMGEGDVYAAIIFDKFPSSIDYSSYLIFNPEVQKIANITVRKQDLVVVLKEGGIYEGFNNRIEHWGNYPCLIYPQYICYPWQYEVPANALEWAVRFTIDVVPKDGTPPCTITKTFNLNPLYNVIDDSEIIGFDVIKNKIK